MSRLFSLASLLLLAPTWAPAQDGPASYALISNATVWDGEVFINTL